MKSKSRALFAVFDGHAGRAAADEAAALFPKVCQHKKQKKKKKKKKKELLTN